MLGYSIFSNGGGAGGGGGGGGGTVTESDVNFYDYDGTLVAAYTLAEAQALSALPSAPDHSADTVPLTFQEWNYTLAQVNAVTRKLDVGATYTTADGKTWFHIRVTAVSGGSIPFCFTKSNATDTLSIDYGDGQTDSDSTNANVTFTPSTELATGDHDVTVWISSGSGTFSLGWGGSGTVVVGGSTPKKRWTLLECFVGEGATISDYAFFACYSLKTLMLPGTIMSFSNYMCHTCRALKFISVSSSVSNLGSETFRYCDALRNVSLSPTATSIPANLLSGCSTLNRFVCPSSITSIAGSFVDCYISMEYDFTACTSVPTLTAGAYSNINSVCIMYIPAALLSTWSTAANWSTYANYMEGV